MKLIIRYLKPYKLRLLIGFTIKLIGTLADLVIPYLLSYIIDEILPTKDLRLVIIYGLAMIASSIICFLFNVWANQMASYICKLFTTNLRHDLFEKINTLSSSQYDEITMPSLISRMTTDTYNVHHMVGMMQRIGVRAPILLIGGVIITAFQDLTLTLILVAILPFIILLSYLITKKAIPLFTKVQNTLDLMVTEIRENVTGIRVIKALSKNEYEKEKFGKINKQVMDLEIKSGNAMAKLSPIMTVLLNMGLVFVVVVGAFRVSNAAVGVGKIISFTTYFTIILNACLTITRIFVTFSRSAASAMRIDYVFSVPTLDDTADKIKVSDIEDNDNPLIEFKDVSFKYNDTSEENVLSNISFKINKNESFGIIGPTGCGKSTIISLLMKFYDVKEGNIYIKGVDINEINTSSLRNMFGTCFQNDTIFTDTVLNNIKFGRDVSYDDVIKASRNSLAEKFILNHEDGYDYLLSPKGTNISGGQKQRIFISRALAGSFDCLILDDATSALDYKTDSILRNNIKNNYSDISTIIIAQRISSIINCDKILMIEDGRILGIGTHKELMESVDEYRSIYISQMGGGMHE